MTRRQLVNLLIPLLGLFIKNPKYFLIALLAGALWYGYEVIIARPAMSYMGVPKAASAPAKGSWSHILRNNGFMLAYSEALENPIWVTYAVTAKKYTPGKRPSSFSSDWRSLSLVSQKDYSGSGYDRGHMAPNYLIASRYGRSAQLDTFEMTNISPQRPTFNRKIWQRLEEVIADDFSSWFGDFWVVTGPIFDTHPQTLKNSRIAVPRAFYKILIKPGSNDQSTQALAFIFPQTAESNADLTRFVTTIDDIEAQTGLDFFSELEDTFEDAFESKLAPEAWRLEEVSTRPSRY